jgi:hypothetical protein
MQATIVAHYGPKPDAVATWLTGCLGMLRALVGTHFEGYEIDQIHGTLIGLERDDRHAGTFRNRNFQVLRGIRAEMDFDGLLPALRFAFDSPLLVQIGGFAPGDDPFRSRGLRPFDRSFSIQGNKAVVMGWPVRSSSTNDARPSFDHREGRSRRYPDSLHRIRLDMQSHGVLHAYHARPRDFDNDFYFRIGTLSDCTPLTSRVVSRTEVAARKWLAAHPLFIEIRLGDLSVAFYEKTELPRATTQTRCLSDTQLSDESIRDGYSSGRGLWPDQ